MCKAHVLLEVKQWSMNQKEQIQPFLKTGHVPLLLATYNFSCW